MKNNKLKLSWEDIGSLDPISSTKTALHIIFRSNVYDCLFKRSKNGLIKPQLCTNWEYINGNLLEIDLKHDVKFHNGKLFNSESIEYTFNKLKNSNMNLLYDSIENIKVINKNKINIILNKHDTSLIPNLTLLPMLTPGTYSEPIGTGPYRFVNYKEGDCLSLISNEKYWNGIPFIKNILYLCCNDPYIRYENLLSDNVDLIFQPPYENIESLKINYEIIEINGPDTIVISINCKKNYFEKNVRKAISYAIDREKIINNVLLNHAIVPKSVLSPPVFGYNTNLDDVKYDLLKAKQLINLTKYKGGFECSLILPQGAIPKLLETASIVKDSLSKLDISVNILDYPEKKAWPLMSDGKYEMFINGWSEITLDPDYNLKSNFLSNNRENLDNDILFNLINNTKNILDEEKRKSAYYKIQVILMDLQSRIPIYHAKDVWVCKKNIKFTPRQDRLIELKDIKLA